MVRTWQTRLVLLVVLTLCVVGCQQQPGAMRSAAEVQAKSTPTVAPSPTSEDFISDVGSYPCGPLGFSINLGEGKIFLAWTPDGAHLVFNYYAGGEVGFYERNIFTGIWLVDAAGSRLEMLVDANPSRQSQYGHHADISPDGTQLVYASCEYPYLGRGNFNFEVAIIGIDGTGQRRLTKNLYLNQYPVWSPDGSRVAFLSTKQDYEAPEGMALYTMAADGSDVQRVAPPGKHGLTLAPPEWSPDGERIAFQVNTDYFYGFLRDLYAVRADGSEMTLLTEEVVSAPAWSPDGQRLAVAKIAGDHVELFTLAADGSDPQLIAIILSRELLRWEPSFGGTIHTVSWSPDGSRLLFSCENGVCIINLESGEVLGLVEDGQSVYFAPYVAAWSPDGTRVAVYTPGLGRPQLYTVALDGTDRRDLILLDEDGNLMPAHPPQDES